MTPTVILDPPHSNDCYLHQQNRNEFIVYHGITVRDKIGRTYTDKRGGTWIGFRCNCTHCPAIAYIHWNELMNWIASGLQ